MCNGGYAATLGPTYAIKSFLRCQSQQRCVAVNTLSLWISPRRNFAANHFPHKLRAAIILMSFESFSVQRHNKKTNRFFFPFFLECESIWSLYLCVVKGNKLQINLLSRFNAARSDRPWLSARCPGGGGRVQRFPGHARARANQ